MSNIAPATQHRRIDFIGGGRGMAGNLPALAAFNAASDREVAVTIHDIKPGVAACGARAARAMGLAATAREVDARTLPPLAEDALLLVQTDDGTTNARVLLQQPQVDKLGFLVVRDAQDRLFTVIADVPAADEHVAAGAAAFFAALGHNAVEGTSSDVWGDPTFAARQPLIRNRIAREFTDRIERKAAGLSTRPGVRMSFDGATSHRVFLFDRRSGFGNPATDAHAILANADVPIWTDEMVVIGEVGRDAEVRLHRVRQRSIDGAVLVEDVPVIDPRGVWPTDGDRYIRAQQDRERLMEIAARNAITRRRPVRTTD